MLMWTIIKIVFGFMLMSAAIKTGFGLLPVMCFLIGLCLVPISIGDYISTVFSDASPQTDPGARSSARHWRNDDKLS